MERFDHGIDGLLTQVRQIKQRMELLENENHALKAQLAQAQRELTDLRRVTVLIDGKPVIPTSADVMPTPIAATYHTPSPAHGPDHSPGLFTQPASPSLHSPNGLFGGGQPHEQRPTRPDVRDPNDYLVY